MTQQVVEALGRIEETLRTGGRENTRNLDEVESAINDSAGIISKIFDFVINLEKSKLQLVHMGMDIKKSTEFLESWDGEFGTLGQNFARMAQLAEVGARGQHKDALRVMGYLELQGRSSEHIVSLMGDMVSLGTTAAEQRKMSRLLLDISKTSNLTSEAAIASLDPLKAFRVQLDALGAGHFSKMSEALINIGADFELNEQSMRELGSLLADLVSGEDYANSVILGVSDNLDALLQSNASVEEIEKEIVKILTEGGAEAKAILGMAKDAKGIPLVLNSMQGIVGDQGVTMARLLDVMNNTQTTDQERRLSEEDFRNRLVVSQESATQKLSQIQSSLESVGVTLLDSGLVQNIASLLHTLVSTGTPLLKDLIEVVAELASKLGIVQGASGKVEDATNMSVWELLFGVGAKIPDLIGDSGSKELINAVKSIDSKLNPAPALSELG